MNTPNSKFLMNFNITFQKSKFGHNDYYGVEFIIRFDTLLNDEPFYMNKIFLKQISNINGFSEMIKQNVIQEFQNKNIEIKNELNINKEKYIHENGYGNNLYMSINPIGKGFNIIIHIGKNQTLDNIKELIYTSNYKIF